jgi:hypothetical protein
MRAGRPRSQAASSLGARASRPLVRGWHAPCNRVFYQTLLSKDARVSGMRPTEPSPNYRMRPEASKHPSIYCPPRTGHTSEIAAAADLSLAETGMPALLMSTTQAMFGATTKLVEDQ